MKEELITDLKPGDIFKLENSGIDVHRIVKKVILEQVDYSSYTLVRVYYEFMDDLCDDTVIQTDNTWNTMKKVYKVLV